MCPSARLPSARPRRWALATLVLAPLLVAALAVSSCSTTLRDVPRPVSVAWPDPAATPLGQTVGRLLGSQDGRSGFQMLASGLDALAMRAGLAEAARHTLDLQYYTLHEDVTTQLLMHRIVRAARRGVRVRLLVDDLYAVGRDIPLTHLAAGENIEVRVFNPFLWRGAFGLSRLFELAGDTTRLNRRMHNKLWMADGVAAVVGGRNLGDVYFDADPDVNFTDLDVLAVGPVVRGLADSFDAYWNSAWSVPVEAFRLRDAQPADFEAFVQRLEEKLLAFRDTVYARALHETQAGPRLIAGDLRLAVAPASVLADPPSKAQAGGTVVRPQDGAWAQLRALVEGARHEILLISPYFIPSEEGMRVLAQAVRRGVRVRVLTNALAATDVPVVHAGYAPLRPALLGAGVQLHEYRPAASDETPRPWRPGSSSGASLHAKALVVDRRHLLVGSMNLDPRSREINTELAVLIDSSELAQEAAVLFEQAAQPTRAYTVQAQAGPDGALSLTWLAVDAGVPVRFETEPASLWRRILATVLGWVAPVGWL